VSLRILFILATVGLLIGLGSAYVAAQQPAAQPPVFSPAPNPYANGIYANGIIESRQSQGANISIFPEVTGAITRVYVSESDTVKSGSPLLQIDDSVQRETTAQLQAQLEVARAQIANARAVLKSATDTLSKLRGAFDRDPGSVSRDALDTASNTVRVDQTSVDVSSRQFDEELRGAAASIALLKKYTIRAPRDGVVLSIRASVGSYVSPQGAYDPYTQSYAPLIEMGSQPGDLQVRCYVDEILINRLPPASRMLARMYVRGTNVNVPLTYERIQPYVSPKIQLSDQRQEQVDVRVLPIIFSFRKTDTLNVFPGQLVDVYIGSK